MSKETCKADSIYIYRVSLYIYIEREREGNFRGMMSESIGRLTIRSPCDSHDKAVTACTLSLQTVVTGLEETLRQWRSIR